MRIHIDTSEVSEGSEQDKVYVDRELVTRHDDMVTLLCEILEDLNVRLRSRAVLIDRILIERARELVAAAE